MTEQPTLDDETTAADPAGAVREPTVTGLPGGFQYGVTRYADIILQQAFPQQFSDLVAALEGFDAHLSELQTGGGNRTPFVARFDASLGNRGWGKRTITISKLLDDELIARPRGHEIDMFTVGSADDPYPGIAVEMEWSNKDPFFDRDLLNYQALHREGALAVGVIVTRGPELQRLIKPTIRNQKGEEKYGESTTHWNKLVPRVNLGGGGECPLILVGIEPDRIGGIEAAVEVQEQLAGAADKFSNWRTGNGTYAEAQKRFAAEKKRILAAFAASAGSPGDSDVHYGVVS